MTPDMLPRFTLLASPLGGVPRWKTVRGGAHIDRLDLVRDGSPLFVEPLVGGKGAFIGVNVFAYARHRPIGAPTRIVREGGFHRFGKRIGITRELQLGDAAFDRAVFIDSTARDQALLRLLGSDGLRRAILDLLAIHPVTLGFGDASATEPHRALVRLTIDEKTLTNPALVERLLESLVEVSRSFDAPQTTLGPYGRGGDGGSIDESPLPLRKGRGVVAVAMVVAPIGASIALPAGHTLGSSVALGGFFAGLALWLFDGLVFALLFRGRSASLAVVLWAWVGALAILPFMGPAAEGLNALLDTGPPSTHKGTAEFRLRRKQPSYVEVHANWLDGQPSAEAPDDTLVRGSEGVVPITAVTRPGAFGVPWLVSVRR